MAEQLNKIEQIRRDILRFLKTTFKVKDIMEISTHKVENYDGSLSEVPFTVTPWGFSQIILNCIESREKDIMAIIEEFPDDLGSKDVSNEYEGGSKDYPEYLESEETVLESRSGKFPDTPVSEPDLHIAGLSVKDAFNWYLYHVIQRLSGNGSKLVPIADAVFALKNDLFLPDDFVPPYLMHLVEGEIQVSVQITVEEIQPVKGQRLIYLLSKCNQNGCFAPHSFYIDDLGGNPAKYFTFEQLSEALKNSFTSLQSSKDFEDFNFSRLLRSVIYTIEVRKTRELKKPMFDPLKIKLLESKGIARDVNGSAEVPESIGTSELKEMMHKAGEKSSDLAKKWLESRIDIQSQ